MSGIRSKVRFREHRQQLVRTLRDFETGKADHLSERERDLVVENIKRRISDINAKIGEASEA